MSGETEPSEQTKEMSPKFRIFAAVVGVFFIGLGLSTGGLMMLAINSFTGVGLILTGMRGRPPKWFGPPGMPKARWPWNQGK
ncbi:MAG: hypothetical protein QM778_28510 [Myxococcales bacterium]